MVPFYLDERVAEDKPPGGFSGWGSAWRTDRGRLRERMQGAAEGQRKDMSDVVRHPALLALNKCIMCPSGVKDQTEPLCWLRQEGGSGLGSQRLTLGDVSPSTAAVAWKARKLRTEKPPWSWCPEEAPP